MAKRTEPATPEMLDAFLEELASGVRTKSELHADPMMPTRWQVRMAEKADENFAEMLADAEMIGLEAMADELVAIADKAVDRDTAAAMKVRVNARQWKLEKLLRARYGRYTEQGGALTHYVVELPAPVQNVEQWKQLYAQPAKDSTNELLSGALNQAPKPH